MGKRTCVVRGWPTGPIAAKLKSPTNRSPALNLQTITALPPASRPEAAPAAGRRAPLPTPSPRARACARSRCSAPGEVAPLVAAATGGRPEGSGGVASARPWCGGGWGGCWDGVPASVTPLGRELFWVQGLVLPAPRGRQRLVREEGLGPEGNPARSPDVVLLLLWWQGKVTLER